ncbi:hypothetical protein N431DRAFT_60744 [Stipitochalara longipes BDJ]|nr:hypothetical protein N431DRAFT_60744 [Stipitochalara longipes BDJ]
MSAPKSSIFQGSARLRTSVPARRLASSMWPSRSMSLSLLIWRPTKLPRGFPRLMAKVETSREIIEQTVKRIHCVDRFGVRTKVVQSSTSLLALAGHDWQVKREGWAFQGLNPVNVKPM